MTGPPKKGAQESPQALAIYGGTFDPVHRGHLACAQAVARLLPGLRLLLLPVGMPPHRPRPSASPARRLAMLELALCGEDPQRMAVDTREVHRQSPCYSYDTLKSFRQDYGEALPILFVLGLDSYKTLPSWQRWQSLTDLAHLLALARPGQSAALPPALAAWQAPRLAASRHALLQAPAGLVRHERLAEVPVSATQVRQAYREGQDASAQVPPQVDSYIRREGLYSAKRETRLAERED